MPITNDEIRSAVTQVIAKDILCGLDSKIRDKLLENSITEAITDWRFTSEIKPLVAAKAAEVAAQLLQEEDWTKRIEETIRAGFDDYLNKLREIVPTTLANFFHGQKGESSYSTRASVLMEYWPKIDEVKQHDKP